MEQHDKHDRRQKCEHKAAPSVVIERVQTTITTEDGRKLEYSHAYTCHCSECGAFMDQGTTNYPEVIASEYQTEWQRRDAA